MTIGILSVAFFAAIAAGVVMVHDDVGAQSNELGCESRKSLALPARVSALDDKVPTLDIAEVNERVRIAAISRPPEPPPRKGRQVDTTRVPAAPGWQPVPQEGRLRRAPTNVRRSITRSLVDDWQSANATPAR